MKVGVLFVSILIVSLALSPVLADRGVIPIDNITVYQESQLAAIAWKDGEEVLVLSSSLEVLRMSDIASSQPADVIISERISLARALEIIPLPSMPEVEEGKIEIFKKLSEIARVQMEKNLGFAGGLIDASRGVSIVYHEVIGLHDVTVVKVKDADELLLWVIDYVKSHRLPMPPKNTIDVLENLVADYVDGGYKYFVFDYVSLGSSVKTLEPLVYRFKSDSIYYPLRISSIIKGYSRITLFILTEDKIRPESFEGTGFDITYEGMIDLSKVKDVDERLAELFEGQDQIWLTTFIWTGGLSSLDRDLNMTIGFSLERIKSVLIWMLPIMVALALITTFYISAYKEVKR